MRQRLDPQMVSERKRRAALVASKASSEAENMESGTNPWPVYNTDVRAYIDVFAKEFRDVEQLSERLAMRFPKEKIVLVDLCGVARGASIGADRSIALTLVDPGDAIVRHDDQTIITGDVLQSGTIERVCDEIRAHGGTFHCLFMRPVGGLGGFGHQIRSHLRLYSALHKLYPLLAEGGEMYFELRGFPGAAVLPAALNAQSPVPLCEAIETRGANDIPLIAIRIRKEPGAPATLRSIDELRSIPGLETRFGSLLTDTG